MRDQPFGGVIGRYHDESKPWWPEPERAPSGVAQRRHRRPRRRRVRATGLFRLGHRHSDLRLARRRTACATRTSTRPPCARPLARACSRVGTTTPTAWAASSRSPAAIPGYNARIPFANGFLSEMLVEADYATFAVGKWHLTPEDECHAGASRARWPLGRGFERFYGFMSGETHQFVPEPDRRQPPRSHPPYGPGGGLPPDHGPGGSGNRRASETCASATQTSRSSCTSLPARATPPTSHRRSGSSATVARSTKVGTRWRDATFASSDRLPGCCPQGTELSPRPDWVPAWDSLSADERRLYARYMEAFAGFLCHTDHEVGQARRVLRRTGDLENTPALRAVRQWRELRGRTHRIDERRPSLERSADDRRGGAGAY